MRRLVPSLLLAAACGGSPSPVASPASSAGTETAAESATSWPSGPSGPTFDIGPGEGCARKGRELWCWGSALRPVDAPGPATSAPVPGLVVEAPDARVVVADGTACLLDGGDLRCFGLIIDTLRDEHEEEPSSTIAHLASDAVDVAIAIGGICWVRTTGLIGCVSIEGGMSVVFEAPARVADARRIAMTDEHACVVRSDGAVLCWGMDLEGVGGDIDGFAGVVTHSGLDAVDVVTGLGFTCVLRRRGQVVCWGGGLLDIEPDADGDIDYFAKYTWPGVRAVEIAAGVLHACARTEHGRVHCLGSNELGQLGDGATRRRSSPVEASELQGAEALAVGVGATCIARGDELRCVGDGTGGSFDGVRQGRVWSRVFTDARALFFGESGHRICALDEQDRLSCVGQDLEGGLLEAIHPRVPQGMSHTSRGVIAFDGARCVLDASGRFACSGSRYAPEPRQGVAEVEGGTRTVCVREQTGAVFCQGTFAGGSPLVQGKGWQRVDELEGAVDLVVDDMGAALCAALGDGRVECRGVVRLGRLGDLRDAVALAMNGSYLCARSRDGRARCVRGGMDSDERADTRQVELYDLYPCFLGKDGTIDCREGGREPVTAPIADVVSIAASRQVLCVLGANGEVHCRGRGLGGELGRVPEAVAIEARSAHPFGE